MYDRARRYGVGAGFVPQTHFDLDQINYSHDSDSSQPPLVPAGENTNSDWDDDLSDDSSESEAPPRLYRTEPGYSSSSDSDSEFMRDDYGPPPPPTAAASQFLPYHLLEL